MEEVCAEHQNKIDRICLEPSCGARALCLLCEHPHGSGFRSIMSKQSESYKKFEAAVNTAVDRYLAQRESSPEERIREEQVRLAQDYFADLHRHTAQFLETQKQAVLARLAASEHESFTAIRQARLDRNYVQVPPRLFALLLQAYEGADLADVFRGSERGNAEEAYRGMRELHDSLSAVMEARRQRLRLALPDIRGVAIPAETRPGDAWTTYEAEDAPRKWRVEMGAMSTCAFDSVISDACTVEEYLLCASYDKKLRAFDRGLALKGEVEYPNILTRVQPVGEGVLAVAVSKEVLVERLAVGEGGLAREALVRLAGHTERVCDLHALNSRILGSCSADSLKIWDLYHERCEYTLKEATPAVLRFLPATASLAVGLASHELRVYSTETMRVVRKLGLPGAPTVLDAGKCPENCFYLGCFPHDLLVVDLRLSTPAAHLPLPADAPTVLADSLNDQHALAVGDRGGALTLLDLRTRRVRLNWSAHTAKTHLARPRGVVGLWEQGEDSWITAGCNDRLLKLWTVSGE